jgi:tRNA1(Val) A37 N6-methylase TrmN6
MLKLGGRLAMVLPAEHIERVKFQATLCGLHLARVCSVKSVARKPAKRILCELVKPCNGMTVMPVVTDELVIQMPDGAVSEAYRQLVEPFYLKL